MSDSQYLDLSGCAELLGIAKRTMSKITRAQGIPAAAGIDGAPYWLDRDMLRWAAAQGPPLSARGAAAVLARCSTPGGVPRRYLDGAAARPRRRRAALVRCVGGRRGRLEMRRSDPAGACRARPTTARSGSGPPTASLYPAPTHRGHDLDLGHRRNGPRVLAVLLERLLTDITTEPADTTTGAPPGLQELTQLPWPTGTVLTRQIVEAARDGRPFTPTRASLTPPTTSSPPSTRPEACRCARDGSSS